MSLVPSYLVSNRTRIRALPAQKPFAWTADYNAIQHPLMTKLITQFPNHQIARADLEKLYRRWTDPVLALVATLVWGGIDTKKKQRFQAVLATPPATLGQKLNSIRAMVRRGLYQAAYLSCCPGGTNEIAGIGPSFFTKVFFFVAQADNRVSPKPLILDKWTTNALFALAYQALGYDPLPAYFSIPSRASLANYRMVPLKSEPVVQAAAYALYTTLMNYWAHAIRVTPAKLEQFVFGDDLRRNPSPSNPRNQLLAIIATAIP